MHEARSSPHDARSAPPNDGSCPAMQTCARSSSGVCNAAVPCHPASWAFLIAPMGRDHRDPLRGEARIQRVAVVRLVADQSLGHGFDEAPVQHLLDKGDLMRTSTCCAYGDWKTMTVCHCHELRTFAPLGFATRLPPFWPPQRCRPRNTRSRRSRHAPVSR